jgi:hypothetical protein
MFDNVEPTFLPAVRCNECVSTQDKFLPTEPFLFLVFLQQYHLC